MPQAYQLFISGFLAVLRRARGLASLHSGHGLTLVLVHTYVPTVERRSEDHTLVPDPERRQVA